mmetsp:Transcript_15686/g.22350  ORF Transcript_15686/g.22350 Transcript_15686/m.22350 type:complete len:605 (+) Transcript_15686:87-1901(+)
MPDTTDIQQIAISSHMTNTTTTTNSRKTSLFRPEEESSSNNDSLCAPNCDGEPKRGRTATETTMVSAASDDVSTANVVALTAVEEEDDNEESSTIHRFFFHFIRCSSPYNGNSDAKGFALDTSTRGVISVGGLFLITALLRLAEDAAGCDTFLVSNTDECTNEIYGMRPSSLITAVQVAVAVLSSLCMPIIGAIIDHTQYRRLIGRLTALLLLGFNIAFVFLNANNWFAFLLLLIPFLFTFSVHSTATFAYFPELTNNEQTLYKYSASFTVIQFLSMLFVLAIVVSSINVIGIQNDVVATAHFSQLIVVAWSTIFFGVAWFLYFSPKPTFADIPPGSTLVTAGFRKLLNTLGKIQNYFPAIQWYLVMIACVNAALPTVTTVVVTVMAGIMNFTPSEVGIATMIVLLSTIPGSWIAVQMARLVNPKRSLQLSLLLWIISINSAALILRGPEHKTAAYLFAVLLGINTGWFDPSERGFYVLMIPKNQDAELMGIYLSSCQIIGWLPPLIFTVMNQAGISLLVNLATLSLYFLLGLLSLSFLVPSYEESVNQARVYERALDESNAVEIFDGTTIEDVNRTDEHVEEFVSIGNIHVVDITPTTRNVSE